MKELLQECIDARSAVHKHYLGQAMPDAVYQLFALVRDDVIPALAQQEQPAQEPVWEDGIEPLASGGLVKLGKVDYAIRAALYAHPAPTQPALSDSQLNVIFNMTAGYGRDDYISFARAIEAHCRGGAKHG